MLGLRQKMFFLVGLGLGENQLTIEALEALKKCGRVFIESYTNLVPESAVMKLESEIGGKITRLKRIQVEDESSQLISASKSNDIALCVVGNPLIATTHMQLLLDAKEAGVKFRVIQGISVQNYLAETGLDAYKFGRIVTVVASDNGCNYSPESFFDFIEKNHSVGLHTLCLLDINPEKENFMTVRESVCLLEEIENRRGAKIISESILLGLAGLGSENALVQAGKAGLLEKFPESPLPQCLVVCGKLNEKEKEALKALSGLR
ncbi:MAG: diphthine synthase [archaeon]